MTWKVHIERAPWRLASRLHMARENPDGTLDIVGPLTMTRVAPYSFAGTEEGGILGDTDEGQCEQFLQAIMDAAWAEGIRPTAYADPTNELSAVRYHLEDMRKLALPQASPKRTEGMGDG